MARSDEQAMRNETLFREANERIADRRGSLAGLEGATPFLCECEDEACTELVRLTAEEYSQVRSGSSCFVIADGHPTRGTPNGLRGDGWVCVVKG